jgi:hypothetical protein
MTQLRHTMIPHLRQGPTRSLAQELILLPTPAEAYSPRTVALIGLSTTGSANGLGRETSAWFSLELSWSSTFFVAGLRATLSGS